MSYYKRNSMTSSVACWYNPETNMLSNKGGCPGFIYFASQHELAVYRRLMSIANYSSRNIEVVTQHVVTIKPPSQQMGMLHWKVDFALQDNETNDIVAYVEAKGGWILSNTLYANEFYQKLHLWDASYPDTFKLLYIVGDKNLCQTTNSPVKIWSINELSKTLLEDLE